MGRPEQASPRSFPKSFNKRENIHTFSACSADSANPKLLNVRGVCHFGRLQEPPTLSKKQELFWRILWIGSEPQIANVRDL